MNRCKIKMKNNKSPRENGEASFCNIRQTTSACNSTSRMINGCGVLSVNCFLILFHIHKYLEEIPQKSIMSSDQNSFDFFLFKLLFVYTTDTIRLRLSYNRSQMNKFCTVMFSFSKS